MKGQETLVTVRRRVFRPWIIATLLALAVSWSGLPAADADGTVTNCASYGSAGTVGDLAWALQGGGTVTFACSGTMAVPQITLSQNTVIDGTGQSVTLSGSGVDRVLYVNPGVTAEVKAITVVNGVASVGGGIYNQYGTLTLVNSTVSGSSATSTGGGIGSSGGMLTLTNSTVSGNSTSGYNGAGGIYISGSLLTLTNSTISGNSGTYGGGINNYQGTILTTNSTVSGNSACHGGGIQTHSPGGTVTLTNSTISGNNALCGGGGGISNYGPLALFNSTISGNSSGYGGGIITYGGGALTLTGSIIAQQSFGANCLVWAGLDGFTSLGYNLDSDGTCQLTTVGDISHGVADLLPLAVNAPGTTATHGLGPNSQARDAIPSGTNGCGTTITTDQRGVSRPQGINCDIGAFELSSPRRTIAVVTNFGDTTASIVDVDASSVRATVQTGTPIFGAAVTPLGVAITPDGTRAYATNFGIWTVGVIDLVTNTRIAELPAAEPRGVAMHPDGTRLYVVNQNAPPYTTWGPHVQVIETATHATVARISTGGIYPVGIALGPGGRRAYVTIACENASGCPDEAGEVIVIDTLNNVVLNRLRTAAHPEGIAVSPDGTRLYVVTSSVPKVVAIDATRLESDPANAIIKEYPLTTNWAWHGIAGIAVHPVQPVVYAADHVNQAVAIINTVDDSVPIRRIGLGDAPAGVSVTPDGTKLLVAKRASNRLAIIDLATEMVSSEVPVGAQPVAFGQFAGYLSPLVAPGRPPLANAGPDQTVDEATLVTLDGSASSPSQGGTLAFAWTQRGGAPVVLSDPRSAMPTFVAPLVPGEGEVLTFELVVSEDPLVSEPDIVNIHVVNVNHTPVAHAGDDQNVREGTLVALSAANSFDPDNDPITYVWVQTGGRPVPLAGADTPTLTFTAPMLEGGVGDGEVLTFQVTVSDGVLSHSDAVTVSVEQDNHSPVANAGSPQTVSPGVLITLDGSASSDPDNDPLAFAWTQVGGPTVTLVGADTAAPSFTAPPANGAVALTFRLTVTDGQLTSEPAEVVVTVNNGPPRCELARAVPHQLWPPDHKMLPIRVVGVTDPENSTVAITVTGVTQDEPVNGLGDGDTAPDAVITADSALLRAERGGQLNGRVYRVHFGADDGQGGICTGTVSVWVPKSKKAGEAMLDDGQLYDSTQW